MHARKQYLDEVRKEDRRADESGRTRLLDEAQKRTGFNQKYLIRMLNRRTGPQPVKARRRRRGAEHAAAVITALVAITAP